MAFCVVAHRDHTWLENRYVVQRDRRKHRSCHKRRDFHLDVFLRNAATRWRGVLAKRAVRVYAEILGFHCMMTAAVFAGSALTLLAHAVA